MSTPQIIRHLHLPGVTPFSRATAIQNVLARQHLDYKAISSSQIPSHPLPPIPTPTIFSFSPTPVYTTGRRELGKLSETTIETLRSPLRGITKESGQKHAEVPKAEVRETLRGGQITFHGPGQLVIYPILDLKNVQSDKWPKGLSARCYVNVLEEATINTLKTFGIVGFRTDNPGVWVDEDRKIAALGLHLRRNITNYGVGLNIRTDLRYFDRIVACGLEGKKTTSIRKELFDDLDKDAWIQLPKNRREGRSMKEYLQICEEMDLTKVSTVWGKEFVDLVWGEKNIYKHQTVSSHMAVAQFLDNGEGNWVERGEEVKNEWEEHRERALNVEIPHFRELEVGTDPSTKPDGERLG